MPPRRWRMGRRLQLEDGLEHYLVTGCYVCDTSADSLRVYCLAGEVIRGSLERLRALWHTHGPTVKSRHPEETFAEVAIRGEEWSGRWGAVACRRRRRPLRGCCGALTAT